MRAFRRVGLPVRAVVLQVPDHEAEEEGPKDQEAIDLPGDRAEEEENRLHHRVPNNRIRRLPLHQQRPRQQPAVAATIEVPALPAINSRGILEALFVGRNFYVHRSMNRLE